MFNLHIRSRNTSQAEMLTITLRKFIFWRKKQVSSAFHFDVYLINVSQTDTGRVRWTLVMTTRLHRIRWTPFADIFHSLQNSTLLYITSNKCVASSLRVSLAVDGLRRSDSVWVYWTTLPILVFFRTWTTSLRFCPWSREKGDEMEDVTYDSEVLNPIFFWFQTLSYIFS